MTTLTALSAAYIVLAIVTLLWLLSLAIKNVSIVDIFWGLGFVILAWMDYKILQYNSSKWLLNILVTIWGLRLAVHIYIRNRYQPEDFRYAKWREEYGSRWVWFSFFQVFLFQGSLMWLISFPILSTHGSRTSPIQGLAILGAVVWFVGFFFEFVGDWQLARFRADEENSGKLLTTGLWKYTRHPNYFGDAVQWWGFYIIAASAGAWWTIFSPALMTFLLMRVSGAPVMEEAMKKRRGYKGYMQKTNAFFPWKPKG